MPRVFAFHFIVENVTDLREKENVHTVTFKLLDFPVVPVSLRPKQSREQRCHAARASSTRDAHTDAAYTARSRTKVRRGKSVVFEMDPAQLVRGLKECPVRVQLQRSNLHHEAGPRLTIGTGAPLLDEVVLNVCEMASSIEALLVSEKSCKFSKRCCIKFVSGSKGTTSSGTTSLYVKYGLTSINEDTAWKVAGDNTHSEMSKHVADEANRVTIPDSVCDDHAHAESVMKEKRADRSSPPSLSKESKAETFRAADSEGDDSSLLCTKPEECGNHSTGSEKEDGQNKAVAEKERQDLISVVSLPTPTPAEYACSPCEGTNRGSGDSDDDSESQVYIPNSMCPPPLFYRCTEQGKVSCRACKELPIHSVSECVDGEEREGQTQMQACRDWLVLAQYDRTSKPITTRLKMTQVVRHDNGKKAAVTPTDNSTPIASTSLRNLPLLSALIEELSHVHIQSHNNEIARETKSTSSQTEPVPSSKKGRKPKANSSGNHRAKMSVQPARRSGGSRRFVRECCVNAVRTKKLVPSNKSVLYPSDIRHKQRCYQSRKDIRSASVVSQRAPRAYVIKKNTVKHKQRKHAPTVSVGPENTEKVGTQPSSAVRKLELFVPTVTQTVSSSLSVSVSSQSSLASVKHRQMTRCNTETQTETGGMDLTKESIQQKMSAVESVLIQTEGGEHANEAQIKAESDGNCDKITPTPPSSSSPITHSEVLKPLSLLQSSPHPHPQDPTGLNRAPVNSSPPPTLTESSLRTSTPPESRKCVKDRQHTQHLAMGMEFRLSKQKFSSTGDIRRALPESPLLHTTTRGSLTSLHDTKSNAPENTLQANTTAAARGLYSQTFDSFASTELLASVGGKGILPEHCREGIVYLATSQSSLASEIPGRLNLTCGLDVGDDDRESQGDDDREAQGDGEREMNEASERSGEEEDYSDDFEDSISLYSSSTSSGD